MQSAKNERERGDSQRDEAYVDFKPCCIQEATRFLAIIEVFRQKDIYTE